MMYDDHMVGEGGSSKGEKSLAKRIAEIEPELHITAHMDSFGGPPGDHDYLKERHARVKKEIAALEHELANFDEAKAIAQIKKSLTADLAHKRANLLECEADLEAADVDYDGASGGEGEDADGSGGADEGDSEDSEDEDGAVVAKGNPYSVMKDGSSYKIVNNESGHTKGTHASRKKAMKQFRLLEMKAHEE